MTRQNFSSEVHKGKNELKDQLIESIREVRDEIENSSGAVTDQAKEHINDNDLKNQNL